MRKNILTVLFSLWVLVTLNACGPIYSTRYEYIPPQDPQSKVCVSQCEISRMQCETLVEQNYQQCQDQQDWKREEYDRCKRHYGDKECSSPSYRYCSNDTDRCDKLYRNCYSACGGQVNSYRECTYNCDQQ